MKKAILCVDDEKSILDSLKGQLKRHLGTEFLIEQAEDVPEAMEIMNDFMEQGIEVVLIVSDWLMPGVKGDEFLIQIHEKWPGIRKILLTGHASAEALQRLRQEDILQAMISKPWQEDELLAAIRSGI